MIAVTAVTLLTALIFYSRSFISSLLPVSVTGGLEYNSHLFFFAPLLLFVLLLWIVKGLVRRFVPRRWLDSSGVSISFVSQKKEIEPLFKVE